MMDNDLFLQHLRELSLEDGKAFLRDHAEEIMDRQAFGELLAEEALDKLYTPFLSLKLAELLIFFGDCVRHLSSHALGLKAKGDALVQIGHYQAAMESLDAAKEEFFLLGDPGNAARSRISWISACAWLGNAEEALVAAAEARNVFLQLHEYYWACVVDHNTALIYDHLGRYQDALTLYERMLSIYPTLNDQHETSIKRSIALAQMNQGINLSWLGRFEQAYLLQQQAQASFAELNEMSAVLYTEMNMATVDYTQGYYGSALRRYYHARDSLIASDIDDPMLLAELKLSIANCLVKLNRSEEACKLASEAVEVYRQFDTVLGTGNVLCEYANTLVASNRLQEAFHTLDEAQTLFKQGGFDHHVLATQLQQAELLFKMGKVDEAYQHACLIKASFDTQGLASLAVHANLVMIDALIDRSHKTSTEGEKKQQVALLQTAKLHCKEVIAAARQYNLQEAAYRSHYLLGKIHALEGNVTKAARYYHAAITRIEHMLHDLVYDLSPSFLHTTWSVYEDMIALCLQQAQCERAFRYLEQARSMALRRYLNTATAASNRGEAVLPESVHSSLSTVHVQPVMWRVRQELKRWQEQYRDLSLLFAHIDASASPTVDREVIQAELRRCEAKISELFENLSLYETDTFPRPRSHRDRQPRPKPFDIAQLQQQLTPGQLLLAYFLSRGKLITFAITAEQLVTHEAPGAAAQLEYLLPLLHAHLQPRGWADMQHPPQQALRRLLNKLYHLLIAPIADLLPTQDGFLTIVPYGPLHQLPFHALYDGTHFLIENFQINYLPASNILMHLSNGKGNKLHTSVSAKQPLVFGYSSNGHVQRTIDEARMVASTLQGSCYLEGDATIAQLIKEAPGSSIIHIATHGQSRLDAPNFSYVLLADGQLNAIDAFSLKLTGCELVTLSGCETGLALSGGGDEQLGLGRAFLAAGAQSLVMSLWTAEDNATNELMRIFYEQLLQGESKVQALRAAQCQFLHTSSLAYTHPYYWAAFRLVGDVHPLRLAEQSNVFAAKDLAPLGVSGGFSSTFLAAKKRPG